MQSTFVVDTTLPAEIVFTAKGILGLAQEVRTLLSTPKGSVPLDREPGEVHNECRLVYDARRSGRLFGRRPVLHQRHPLKRFLKQKKPRMTGAFAYHLSASTVISFSFLRNPGGNLP